MSISALNASTSNDVTGYATQTPPPATTTPSGTAATAGATKPDPIVSTGAPTNANAAKPTASQIADAVSKLNDFAANAASDLNFSTDKDTGLTIVKVVDTATNKVIRQIPSEEAVSIAKSMDKLQGLLINHSA
ncbi:flagellar protein FlaG [Herbaspirillum sp. RTI4]|uniref:flagellar protein FlaG n=1 Tax=Herbaspirillum sp. RTI4 TaxID=3048640 RepID=UPI002AB4E54C|nr:flagellar protein FlaG [Herbaspirillum sp. RTI4]MDY7578327.1 flagellar protein FlaG [Herbaspirillum sp. RTI4]MEA9981180.1 flagellar protein FlaG [Herbaspirillum sp. RTI4]